MWSLRQDDRPIRQQTADGLLPPISATRDWLDPRTLGLSGLWEGQGLAAVSQAGRQCRIEADGGMHQEELRSVWDRARKLEPLGRVEPLP